jgi:hypothetical protein
MLNEIDRHPGVRCYVLRSSPLTPTLSRKGRGSSLPMRLQFNLISSNPGRWEKVKCRRISSLPRRAQRAAGRVALRERSERCAGWGRPPNAASPHAVDFCSPVDASVATGDPHPTGLRPATLPARGRDFGSHLTPVRKDAVATSLLPLREPRRAKLALRWRGCNQRRMRGRSLRKETPHPNPLPQGERELASDAAPVQPDLIKPR